MLEVNGLVAGYGMARVLHEVSIHVASGEIAWALLRGTVYSTVFLLTMLAFGLVTSPWAVLAIPSALLIGERGRVAAIASPAAKAGERNRVRRDGGIMSSRLDVLRNRNGFLRLASR